MAISIEEINAEYDHIAREAMKRGASLATAQAIAQDVLGRGTAAQFLAGTDPGVLYGVSAQGRQTVSPTEIGLGVTVVPTPTPTPTASPSESANDAVTAAIAALVGQLAASNEQAARDRANQLALQQAVSNTQLGLQAQDTETSLLNALSNPRAAFMSQFMLRGNQEQGVPITPVLAGLLRRQNLPVSGNIPGAPLYMRPDDINSQALIQAFQGANQNSINALSQDPIEREMMSGMAQLAGLDPSAFWNIRTPLPRSASLTPSFIRL